ncbi:TPR domain-containing glycosyltransferase [Clostridium sp. BSD9I1]|uniref:TPR domain-containing glycosyltransferase n=1 Tax=Clostridium sp. BSD9I1 TaxID=2003589 RepID=UPI0016466675|nr:TPR domain-containing glycosyltransferase [Clostridium sp. BSD9I1]
MKNLSIVIKEDSKDNIYNYIKILNTLLEDGESQLVIINNLEEKLDIEYDHIIYEFKEDYKKFREFCYASCFNKNILIIESGMVLNEELVKHIKELLVKYKDVNIKLNIKRYYLKDNYYKKESNIIYNLQTLDEKKLEVEIDDFCYFNNLEVNLNHNVTKFIKDNKFQELYLWYKNYIIKDENIKLKFYNCLEKSKIELENIFNQTIENYFISEKLDCKYCEYLCLRRKIINNELSKDYLKNVLEGNEFNEEDIYFTNIILELFKRKELICEIFTIINKDTIDAYMKNIFDEYNNFYLIIYDFLTSTDTKQKLNTIENQTIEIYMNLIEIYSKNMSYRSEKKHEKDKIIRLFEDYLQYGLWLLNNNSDIKKDKRDFLIQIKQALNLINLRKVEDAVTILKEVAEIYEIMTMPTRYYIQKIIRVNNIYKYKLSICIMAKNEEKFLGKCLKSIKPLIDSGIAELIFVDTGSTDKTFDIASKYTNKIYIKAWQGNFSKMRNYCISLAQGEYLFIPDADEELEQDGSGKLIELFSTEEYKEYSTYTFKEKNYEDTQLKKYSMIVRNFIFKNEDTFYYSGSVHNQPNFKKPIMNLDLTILHYGYIMNSREVKEKKFNRTGYILKKELEKEPQNLYYRYQLTKSYSIYGKHKESLNQAKLFMKILQKVPLDYKYIVYYNAAAIVYFCNTLYDETIKICDDILSISPEFIDAIYFKAQSLFLKKNYEEAIDYYKYYLKILKNIYKNPIINDTRLEFYSVDSKKIAETDIMISYLSLCKYSEFIEYTLTENKDGIVRHQFGMINSYIQLKSFRELAIFYKEYIYFATENDKLNFIYYIRNEIINLNEQELKILFNEFNKLNIKDEYTYLIKSSIEKREKNSLRDTIKFMSNQDVENLSAVTLEKAIINIITFLINNEDVDLNLDEITKLRKITKYILVQALNKKTISGLNKEHILKIILKHMNYSFLVYENMKENLSNEETLFLEKISLALQYIENKDIVSAVKAIKDAVLEDEEMANAMVVYIEHLIGKNEKNIELENYALVIKDKIKRLIEQGIYEAAKKLIEEYESIIKNDLEILSMKVIIYIVENKLNEAETLIKEGLELDGNNFDLLYNLGYIYEIEKRYHEAIEFYSMAKENASEKEIYVEIDKLIDNITTVVEGDSSLRGKI